MIPHLNESIALLQTEISTLPDLEKKIISLEKESSAKPVLIETISSLNKLNKAVNEDLVLQHQESISKIRALNDDIVLLQRGNDLIPILHKNCIIREGK